MRLTIAIAAFLAVPIEAQAQFVPTSPPPSERMPGIFDRTPAPSGPGFGRDLGDVRQQIDRSRSRGDLTRREARSLRRDARQIGTLSDRYGRDGISGSERRELDNRVQALRSLANARSAQGKTGKR